VERNDSFDWKTFRYWYIRVVFEVYTVVWRDSGGLIIRRKYGAEIGR
jgi:hypothetical protein